MNDNGKPIKILRSDNGEKCSSKEFETLNNNGIIYQLSELYNPAQNDVAKAMNRTIVESTIHVI